MHEFLQKHWINYGGGPPGLCIVCYLVGATAVESTVAVLLIRGLPL